MKSNQRSFWKGIAVGGLLFAGLGALYANQSLRLQYALRSLGGTSNSFAHLQANIEQDLNERAFNTIRAHAWGQLSDGRFANCMQEHRWLLWPSTAMDDCLPILSEQVPEDWQPIDLEKAREHALKMKGLQDSEVGEATAGQ